MKQCKVCGMLVHIDSNTCPSCGNHSFFVLDVKICPLCGKVNNITSSFCEQCGKQFVAAQGVPFVKKTVSAPRPLANPYRERPAAPPVRRQEAEIRQPQKSGGEDYEIEKPVIRNNKSLINEENAAERAYKDFVALKPEVLEKEDYSEFSYYVKGDANKLPVIILPKFAKTSGKNIIVNIVVGEQEAKAKITAQAPAEQLAVQQEIKPQQAAPQKTDFTYPEPKAEILKDDILTEAASPANSLPENEKTGEFRPFSAIEDNKPADIYKDAEKAREELPPLPETVIVKEQAEEEKKDKKGRVKEKKVKPEKIRVKRVKQKKYRQPLTFGAVLSSAALILMLAGLFAAFTMPFYSSLEPNYVSSALSPVLYLIQGITGSPITLPFAHNNGYANYAAAYAGGQFAHLASFMPYVFAGLLILSLASVIIHAIGFRYKKWARIVLIFTGLLILLCQTAIMLAIKFVFNSGVVTTLGPGLLIAGILSFVYYVSMLFLYKPQRED